MVDVKARAIALLLASYARPVKCATTLLKNAKIYTVNPDAPLAEAIAIDEDDGTILAIGSNLDVEDAHGDGATIYDMGGRLVLPGFQDVHLHVVEAGITEAACVFDPQPVMTDIPFYFDDCPDTFGDQGWLLGGGLDVSYVLEQIASGSDSPLKILDQVYPTKPVVILDNLGHGAIANTAAMKAVGYDVLVSDPPGGQILRDETTGALLGIVTENAQQKLRDAAFPPTAANLQTAYESLLAALTTLASNGVTSVSDAGGFWRQAQTQVWDRVENEGKMTVRASNALYIYPDQPFAEQLPELIARFTNDPTRLVQFNQAKIYVDGILSLGTGAMYSPYLPFMGLPPGEELGFEYFSNAKTLNTVSSTLADNGFQLHFHVTGDRGTGLALDAIAGSSKIPGHPHRLTHCYLVDARDRGRFTEMDVIADFQLAPSSVSQDNLNFITQALGASRSAQLLPAVELYNTGARLTLSSDWDADDLSPMVKIKTVMTRAGTGTSFSTVESVIPLMTINPAELMNTNTGSLEVGKKADLVALDMDIFSIPVATIDQAKVVFTMFNGDIIFDPNNIGTPVISDPPSVDPPTSAPVDSPAPFCFAGTSQVLVQDERESLEMRDLQLGDYVLTSSGHYERVYSFGHYHKKMKAEYLLITTDVGTLTISKDHMVFTSNSRSIPASLLGVNDTVLTASATSAIVHSIETVLEGGVYAPFTASGNIVVNGILASCYVALGGSESLELVSGVNISYQFLAHLFESPHRLFCLVAKNSCKTESYASSGISTWVNRPLQFSKWLILQNTVVRTLIVIPLVAMFLLFRVVEMLGFHTYSILAAILFVASVTLFAVRKTFYLGLKVLDHKVVVT